ncbi:cubilin-like [Penaeus indicus]|uniref:cubilin-like n=1 Tax=Penaeus indicus TaxID=29960 RepID=UPI00300D8450
MCGGKMCFCCLPVSVCNGTGPITLTEGDCLQIHSPNYPLPYEDNTDCSLTVVAPPVCQIVLQFCHLSLERCPYDFLNITDGMTTSSFCGKAQVLPSPASLGNSVTVQFSTDFSQVNIGFNLAVSLNCAPLCSDVVATSSVGVIFSPGYPGTYSNFLNCNLTVTVATSTAISFDYLNFNLEEHPTCSYDFLTINDTISTESDWHRASCLHNPGPGYMGTEFVSPGITLPIRSLHEIILGGGNSWDELGGHGLGRWTRPAVRS